MTYIWRRGFNLASIDELVVATCSNRQALYKAFGDKDGVLAACLDAYNFRVVTPAFSPVEADDATLADVEAYFKYQIARAETMGLPGPGCLMANVMTEVAPHNTVAAAFVGRHLARLHGGFARAIRNSAAQPDLVSVRQAEGYATCLVAFANGLWSMTRVLSDAQGLRCSVAAMLRGIRHELARIAQ